MFVNVLYMFVYLKMSFTDSFGNKCVEREFKRQRETKGEREKGRRFIYEGRLILPPNSLYLLNIYFIFQLTDTLNQ